MGGVSQACQNTLQNRFNVADYFIIPEAQHFESAPFEEGGSLSITCGFHFIRVLTSIKLDDYSAFDADEIHNVIFNPILSSEFEATQLAIAEVPPQ